MLIGSWISELLVITAAGAAGWLVGLASAWLTDCVMRLDGGPYRLPENFLVRDPLVQGAVAATWMILAAGGLSLQVVRRGAGFSSSRSGSGDGLALRIRLYGGGWVRSCDVCRIGSDSPPGEPRGQACPGLLSVWLSMSLLRTLGRVAYAGATMGRGDVLIAAMVGAAAGSEVFVALAVGLVLNGLLGLYVLRAKGSMVASMPYAPGLCAGGLISLVLR